MYETYWQLDEKPFENGWDPRFYYPSEVHQGALLKLRYAVENRRGAALLAGASGLGKTLLVQSLRRQLPEEFTPLVHVVFPLMPTDQLLAFLAEELGAPPSGDSVPSISRSVRQIERTLAENAQRGHHAILVIDEAHLLPGGECFEAMRLLLNFELASCPSLTLLLVGQPSLLTTLGRMTDMEERLGVKCLLRPLTLDETVSYVSHRLSTAGADRVIFSNEALETLFRLTHGVPRKINRLCDLALLIGFAEGQSTISSDHVEGVSEELVTVAPD